VSSRTPCTPPGRCLFAMRCNGLGRTGAFYAFEHYGLAPDIITISKALSGGYIPVGAMLTSDKISRYVQFMDRAMVHSTTFRTIRWPWWRTGHTLVFDDEQSSSTPRPWASLARTTRDLASRHEFLHVVRGRGQMIGIEFDARRRAALGVVGA